jgi:hypothetical protein
MKDLPLCPDWLVPAVIGFAGPPVIRSIAGAEQDFRFLAMAFFASELWRQAFHGGVAIARDQIEDGVGFDEALMPAATAFRDHAEMKESNLLQQDLVSGLVADATGYTHHTYSLTDAQPVSGLLEQI